MARRDPATRSIRLSEGRSDAQQPGGDSDDDVNRALQHGAKVRDRDQLPSKVKVITTQAILDIVKSITGKMELAGDRDEVNQLVLEQTQMQVRMQQLQVKLDEYKGEYKKLYEAYKQSKDLVKQAQDGNAGSADFQREYEAQIAELQQRNAHAVDVYMDLQQQLDQTGAHLDEVQSHVAQLEASLQQRDEQINQLEQALAEAEHGGAAALEDTEQVAELQARIDELTAQLDAAMAGDEALQDAQQELQAAQERVAELEGQLESAGSAQEEIAQLREQLKQGQRSNARVENMELELEKLRTAEGEWLEEKRRLAGQLSNETSNRQAAEERLQRLESGEALPDSAKAVQERAEKAEADVAALKTELENAKAELAKVQQQAGDAAALKEQLAKASAELEDARKQVKQGQDALADSGNAAKELAVLKRKFENVESELEELRTAEGKWLEDKRRLASQLSNETNLRRDVEAKLSAELERLSKENEEGKKKLTQVHELEAQRAKAQDEKRIAERSLSVIEDQNNELVAERDALKQRVEELEQGAAPDQSAEVAALKDELELTRSELNTALEQAKSGTAQAHEVAELRKANQELKARTEKVEALNKEVEDLRKRHQEASGELVRVGSALTNSEVAAERAREDLRELRERLESAQNARHEAEKQLVDAKARLESEQQLRNEHTERIRQLEGALQRERQTVDSSAPAAALESLSSQLAAEREKWERVTEERDRQIDDLQKKVGEAEVREAELASQLEGVELSQQDVIRAKALAGQRRAQIERMQQDVESARRQAKEAETFWKDEMRDFKAEVAAHLEAAENGEEGSDLRLQKLMEKLKAGVSDKYAKLRRKHNRTTKELEQVNDKLAAIERILAKREAEEARLRKIIDELEGSPGSNSKPKAARSKARKK
jgi:chromosome segregation ATPase